MDQSEINKKFEEYKEKGQIKFVTFHPSYGYEEFIEGITAKTTSDGIEYINKDGIFKEFCTDALYSIYSKKISSSNKSMDFEKSYGMLLENISESESIKLKSGKKIILKKITENDNLIFSHENRNNEYVVSKSRLKKIYDTNQFNISGPSEVVEIIGGCNSSIYFSVIEELKKFTQFKNDVKLTYEEKKILVLKSYKEIKKLLKEMSGEEKDKLDKYVFIIDEINRGDMSKIFGELITLIEEDKRIGEDNELYTNLPTTGEEFGVPPNVYVIGTMNTADRSIALIDIALRRRFRFEEMKPNFGIFEELGITYDGLEEGIKLFKVLNERITKEEELGRDKNLGHSFLFKIKNKNDLTNLLKYEICPLLQEYCYNSTEMLKKILEDNKEDPSINDNLKLMREKLELK